MPRDRDVRAPWSCRGLVRAASWIVPPEVRPPWRSRWEQGLRNWWTLVERGDQSSRTRGEICRAAFSEALRLRYGTASPERLVRGASCIPAVSAVLLLALAVFTRGFPATRALIETARGHARGPLRTLALTGAEDRLVGHSIVIAFALVVALVAAVTVGLRLRRYGWRYWGFLALKSVCAGALVTLAWLEGSQMLRGHLPSMGLKAIAGGLAPALLYIAAFGWALAWSVKDQRRRCPVCLRRLALPVRMGSWASVFDPPTTELLCESGHGRMCVCETAEGELERWTESDATWRELFQPTIDKQP
jgi:hypothetical protein